MDEYFSTRPKENLTIGVEVECYLWDEYENILLEENTVLDKVLDSLPQVITRDYYTYQLEVRTTPHGSPVTMLEELKTNFKLADKICKEQEIRLIPMSWLGAGEMFNGLHMHFRNGDRNRFEQMLFNIYPFVLTLTDVFKFSPSSENVLSYRFGRSPHVAIPVFEDMIKSQRYSDVCLNSHKENTRHRLKSCNTLEVRTFDIPFNFEYMENLTKLMFSVVENIKVGCKIGGYDKLMDKVKKSRNDIIKKPIGYNYVLDDYNAVIYSKLCDRFGIKKLKVPFSIRHDWKLKEYVNTLDVKKYMGE